MDSVTAQFNRIFTRRPSQFLFQSHAMTLKESLVFTSEYRILAGAKSLLPESYPRVVPYSVPCCPLQVTILAYSSGIMGSDHRSGQ